MISAPFEEPWVQLDEDRLAYLHELEKSIEEEFRYDKLNAIRSSVMLDDNKKWQLFAFNPREGDEGFWLVSNKPDLVDKAKEKYPELVSVESTKEMQRIRDLQEKWSEEKLYTAKEVRLLMRHQARINVWSLNLSSAGYRYPQDSEAICKWQLGMKPSKDLLGSLNSAKFKSLEND